MLPDSPHELARVRNSALLASGVTWILLLAGPDNIGMVAHCPAPSNGTMPLSDSWQMLLAMNQVAPLAAGWMLMLVAMMSPVLIAPLRHIRLRSFTRRRGRSIILFATGYALIWMAVGGAMLALEVATTLLAPQSYLLAAGAMLVALVWQCSPVKQRCLNRGHAHPELAAFGAAADFAAFRFGLTHGIWCAASCWPWMLLPMLLPRGHVAAMATAGILIFSERLEQPALPSWRFRGLRRVLRILAGQTRMRVDGCGRLRRGVI